MTRFRVVLFIALLFACSAAEGFGQFKTELVNQQGATAPCVGIGPIGGPLAKNVPTCLSRLVSSGRNNLGTRD